jgi:hypothetical protein
MLVAVDHHNLPTGISINIPSAIGPVIAVLLYEGGVDVATLALPNPSPELEDGRVIHSGRLLAFGALEAIALFVAEFYLQRRHVALTYLLAVLVEGAVWIGRPSRLGQSVRPVAIVLMIVCAASLGLPLRETTPPAATASNIGMWQVTSAYWCVALAVHACLQVRSATAAAAEAAAEDAAALEDELAAAKGELQVMQQRLAANEDVTSYVCHEVRL